MAARVLCNNCGGRVDVPAGHTRAKIRCPGCGYYAEVPPDLRGREPAAEDEHTAPVRRSAPPPPPDLEEPPLRPGTARPVKKAARPKDAPAPAPAPARPPLLEGTQEEDDDKPYAVPADDRKKCPACRKELPVDATFCVHCGGDLSAGRKKKREFQPVDRFWESRWTFQQRLTVFLILLGLNVLALVVMTVAGNGVGEIGLLALLFNTGMQAFLVGSYESLRLKRSARGQVSVTRTWRIAFVPKPPEKVAWKDSHMVGIVATNHTGTLEWGMFIYLLICTACPPVGIGFYLLAMRPDRYEVTLCDVHGATNAVVFRTTNRETAEEVCTLIADCTGLVYRSVM